MTAPTGAFRRPAGHARALDATAEDIDQWAMPERTAYLQELREVAAPLGAGDRWMNLEGVIDFFASRALGAPGTWISRVNAGVLEAIQDGIALALDRTNGNRGNPGAPAWAEYLSLLHAGQLSAPSQHAQMWSIAKEISTETAVQQAEQTHGLRPTAVERDFLALAQAYNWGVRNRPAIELAIQMASVLDSELDQDKGFLDWFMDVGDPDAARIGCEIAWDVACRRHRPEPMGPLGLFGLILAHLPRLTAVYDIKASHNALPG